MSISIALVVLVLAAVIASVVWVGRLIARDGYGRIPDHPTDSQVRTYDPTFRVR